MRIFFIVLCVASIGTSAFAQSRRAPELVVLVHGMGRTSASMQPLAKAFRAAGYRTLNWSYSSTCCTVAELGGRLSRDIAAARGADSVPVHFVGHSLGTVIIRWVVARDTTLERVGRIVMLAPPNQGSHEADRYAGKLGWFFRPLPELRTAPNSTARLLPVPRSVQIGVIAGKYDGKVSIAETHLEGETGHVVVPAAHSFMMRRKDVKQLAIRFVRTGKF